MIKINIFGALNKFFVGPMQLELKNSITLETLIKELQTAYPDATEILSKSRVAINETFVPLTTIVDAQTEIFLIPPSSGG